MTVPANYGTPERLITMALRDCGKLAQDAVPDSEQFLDGMQRLADILYFQQTRGLTLWLLEDITVPLIAGQATYTFGPGGDVETRKPFRVEFGYATDGAQENRRPVTPLSYTDYVRLSNVVQTGQVTQYFVNKQLELLYVSLWLVPDATQVSQGSVHLVMRTKAEHLTMLNQSMTFPTEWYLALRWALAAELSTGQSTAIQNRCQGLADRYIDALEGWNIEDVPLQIQVDMTQMERGRFR